MRDANEWEAVAGEQCCQCGGLATHVYGNVFLCCDCHAGENNGFYTRREAEVEHARILVRRAESGE